MVDFRKSKSVPSTLTVNNSEVEIVDSFNVSSTTASGAELTSSYKFKCQ